MVALALHAHRNDKRIIHGAHGAPYELLAGSNSEAAPFCTNKKIRSFEPQRRPVLFSQSARKNYALLVQDFSDIILSS
jgi:hypothetical protein